MNCVVENEPMCSVNENEKSPAEQMESDYKTHILEYKPNLLTNILLWGVAKQKFNLFFENEKWKNEKMKYLRCVCQR